MDTEVYHPIYHPVGDKLIRSFLMSELWRDNNDESFSFKVDDDDIEDFVKAGKEFVRL